MTALLNKILPWRYFLLVINVDSEDPRCEERTVAVKLRLGANDEYNQDDIESLALESGLVTEKEVDELNNCVMETDEANYLAES